MVMLLHLLEKDILNTFGRIDKIHALVSDCTNKQEIVEEIILLKKEFSGLYKSVGEMKEIRKKENNAQ